MEEIIKTCVEQLTSLVQNNNILISVFFGMFIIVLESIIPILPLALFIAINTVVFGNVLGFIISWISTIIGCSLSFWIFRSGLSKKLYHHLEKKDVGTQLMEKISTLDFTKLVLVLAIPFTPAFSINIGAGLSKMPYRKYLLALIISKLSIIYFWGFIGSTFIESMTDIGVLLKLVMILGITFLLSRIVIKCFKIT